MSVDIRWFSKNDFSKYKGKYVAIVDRKVIASGKNAKKVWEEAKKQFPKETPAIAKISDKETYVLFLE